ncbi:MAG: ArsR/SmtB family transcription factor [bacterium]
MTEKQRGRKDDIDGRFARLAKALSSSRRLELLDALARCPSTVENLANQTGMTMANASQHLQVLRGAGLVESDKDGLFVCYRVASADVPEFLLALRRLAASIIGDVERILPHSVQAARHSDPVEPSMPESDEANTQPCEERGDVQEHDRRARPPKLRSMPLADLEEGAVAACFRSPYCALAQAASGLPRSRELSPMRRVSGVQEWRDHGYLRDVVSPGCLDGAMSRDS